MKGALSHAILTADLPRAEVYGSLSTSIESGRPPLCCVLPLPLPLPRTHPSYVVSSRDCVTLPGQYKKNQFCTRFVCQSVAIHELCMCLRQQTVDCYCTVLRFGL